MSLIALDIALTLWIVRIAIVVEIIATYRDGTPPTRNNYYRIGLYLLLVGLSCLKLILK
jgi:hypothetical protein